MRAAVVVLLLFAAGACHKHDPAPPASRERDQIPMGSATIQTPPARQVLQPNEGTLTIEQARGATGSALTARVKVTPAAGFHINTAYPVALKLEPTAAVMLAKTRLDKNDADITEGGLEVAVTSRIATPGTYAVAAVFDFAVCDDGSCHQKHQPIKIDFVAN